MPDMLIENFRMSFLQWQTLIALLEEVTEEDPLFESLLNAEEILCDRVCGVRPVCDEIEAAQLFVLASNYMIDVPDDQFTAMGGRMRKYLSSVGRSAL